MRKVIVAGAGASGLVAAICAARSGAQVTVIEHMEKAGKKILATGNGRCNYTNEKMDMSCFRSENMDFLKPLLERFGTSEILDFFEDLGIVPKCKEGYYYPYSMQAASVAEVLVSEAEHLKVKFLYEEKVLDIHKLKEAFVVKTDRRTLKAHAVILATGGQASKKLGSDGSGYGLAKAMGHSVTAVVPALTGLKCRGRFFKGISGVRIYGKVSVYCKEVTAGPLASDTGELQMTAYGISGIPVFQVSRYAAMALKKGYAVCAVLDFMPAYPEKQFEYMIEKRFRAWSYKTASETLVGLLPSKMIHLFLSAAAIDDDTDAGKVPKEKLQRLVHVIKHFEMAVTDTNTFDEAQVCAGGVATSEVSPETMMSKRVSGLYIVGELLDVDGICGGYNLHFAWASGMAAGFHAGQQV